MNPEQYRTAEGGWVKDAPFWTVAYRSPRANRILRVDLALTWQEAFDLSAELAAARPDLQVFYTTNAAAEAAGYCPAEDARNIMVESGRRVRILEGGTLRDFATDFASRLATAATPEQVARGAITFEKIAPLPQQRAIGDTRPASRYAVHDGGTHIGDVGTYSRESRTAGRGRIAGRLIGYDRTWKAWDVTGRELTAAHSRTRVVAVERLAAHAQQVTEARQ